MGTDENLGESVLSVLSLLESAVTGNLLTNQPVDGLLYTYHRNLSNSLKEYLNNSKPTNNNGDKALSELLQYVDHKQSIIERKCALDQTGEFIAVSR